MDPLGNSSYYVLLGVRSNASPEEIRSAFHASAKRVHPDRINKSTNPIEWEYANQMMAALTRAYSVLRDPAQRAMYDARLNVGPASSFEAPPNQSRPDPRRAALRKAQGEVVRGKAHFRKLSGALQDELLRRQAGDSRDSIRKATDSPFVYYFGVAAAAGWYWYIFQGGSSGYEWSWKHQAGYYAASALTASIGAGSLFSLHHWYRSSLRPSFYLTRLHYVVTTLESVSYWPIWEFRDASVVHHHTNGKYDNSTLSFFLGDDQTSLNFKSKEALDNFWSAIQRFQKDAIDAERRLDADYFNGNNLFRDVVSEAVVDDASVPGKVVAWAAAAGLALCFAASVRNDDLRQTRWYSHGAPAATSAPQRVDDASRARELRDSQLRAFALEHPPQPLPSNGEMRGGPWQSGGAPFKVNAKDSCLVKLVHIEDGQRELTVFVQGGRYAEVDVPLGTYEMRYAIGETWYGYEYLFGPETSYAKADRLLTFSQEGNRLSGVEVTLHKVRYGNLSTTNISAEKF